MVKFLLNRPISVLMTFLAAVILGATTYFSLPVSLLPDIDIPQITVQIQGEGIDSRELENTATAPLRRHLLQTGGLADIKSETRDGMAIIQLHFDYGVDTDLAFIEVNEKIDAAMNSLPRDLRRPKAIKASATDIPVIYLNMTLRKDEEGNFLELANLAENIVRRRIEQLPQVAMADITGVPRQQLKIIPDRDAMASAGIIVSDIESALSANNSEPGGMSVRDGYYEYNINISNQLRTPEDVSRIFIRKGNRLLQLGDFCKIDIEAGNPQGYSYYNGKRAVTLAIIKKSEEDMGSLKEALAETAKHFEPLYPEVEFTQSRDQTALLDSAISNLEQNLIIGFIFVFLLSALFIGNIRSSIVVAVSVIGSFTITFLMFYLFKVSINIISLSGLILAVGMMIDNSVIVIENITQMRQRGATLTQACIDGTSEMITPLLSSSLTTVAVFVPLVFMSGIAGAIFRDQAFAITTGLAVSYIVGIMVLPVLYHLFFYRQRAFKAKQSGKLLNNCYTSVFNFCFKHKWVCIALVILTFPACVVLTRFLPVEHLPKIDRDEMLAHVEWNENINLDENTRRIQTLVSALDTALLEVNSAAIGTQDYLLDSGNPLSSSEAEIYVKSKSTDVLADLQRQLSEALKSDFPNASLEIKPEENIFEKIFSTSEPQLEVRLHSGPMTEQEDLSKLEALESRLGVAPTPMHDRVNLVMDREKLLLYKVSANDLSRTLRTAFKANHAGTLRSQQQYLPIVIGGEEQTVNKVLAETFVGDVPVKDLLSLKRDQSLKSINAGADGEYIPFAFDNLDDPVQKMSETESAVEEISNWDVSFSGSIFSNRKMMRELTVILAVSLLLMYFILCAQFGSFIQPLLVLLEIPIDTAFALIILWLCSQTLNVMSAIGIIITCGVVINDTILKIDAINELRAEGLPLLDAIHTAGVRRLRPIIMTSLTTIAAMVPILFASDMGSELQRPLAIAMIGSMVVGTLVSIFIIPIFYWLIYRKSDEKVSA